MAVFFIVEPIALINRAISVPHGTLALTFCCGPLAMVESVLEFEFWEGDSEGCGVSLLDFLVGGLEPGL